MSKDTAENDNLASFVHRWAEAIVANDVSRMEAFVTDDWLLVDGPGIIPRDAFHSAVANGQLSHNAMKHEVLHSRKITEDVALLITQATSSGAFQGEPIAIDEWTSDILVRTAEGWKCVLTQLTPRSGSGKG